MTTKALSEHEFKRASELMKILSHPTRLRLAFHLAAGESSVAEMERVLEIRQPSLSQHLGELREAALVTTRRQHKLVFYTLTDASATRLLEVIPAIIRGEKSPQLHRQDSMQQARHGGAAMFAIVEDVS